MAYKRQNLPSAVARQLRQEAGFGCARCGHPYIEYHHIVPYADEVHFRCEDMMALCGQCHPAVAKQGSDRQYELKNNPYNQKNGKFKGALEYDKRDLIFKVGGNWYENTPNILVYKGLKLISCNLVDNQALVSMNLLNDKDEVVFSLENNEINFRIDDFWDFEYKHNYAIVRRGPGNIALLMDFRNKEAVIEGSIWLGGRMAKLGKEETTLPGNNVLRGNRIANCGTGIML